MSGPEPPAGREANWVRSLPEIGWFPIIRLYGPLEPWIDSSWKPDDSRAHRSVLKSEGPSWALIASLRHS